MKILVIGNPISGKGRGNTLIDDVSEKLKTAGHSVETLKTTAAGDACKAASETDVDQIVSVGGDGTTAEIATGLGGKDTPIAIVPAGTANVLARELNLPAGVADVCAAINAGNTTSIDSCVLKEDGKRFLLSMGIGLDARVIHEVAGKRSGTLMGYISYIPAVIDSLVRYAPDPYCVEVDGKVISEDAAFTVVANAKHYILKWKMMPGADPTDGVVDVLSFKGRTVAELADFVRSFAFQKHEKRKDVDCARGKTVRIYSPTNAQTQIHVDGDPAGHLPVEFTVDPQSVRIVIP